MVGIRLTPAQNHAITVMWVMIWAACCLIVPITTQGQVQTTSGISGRVTDASGALIVGASVTATNEGTGEARKTATNTAGYYSFTSLSPGPYTVKVKCASFQTSVVTHRQILAAQPAIVDVALQVGSTNDQVTVSAAGSELITRSSAELAASIEPKLMSSAPVIRQSFLGLLTLVPGAAPQNVNVGGLGTSMMASSDNNVLIGNETTPTGVFLFGNRDSGNNISIDGANVQDSQFMGTSELQSPADIQEVKVESGMMTAEFGNGVAAVSVITKSGTNQFHGEVYEYLRNNKLDATDFFTKLVGRSLPTYQQNQYGFAFGGPIKRSKLLFFGNFEQFRLHQTTVAQENTPTADLLNGRFATYQPPLTGGGVGPTPTIYNPYQYNPATGLRTPFPNNQIPLGPTTLCAPRPTCVDPAVLAYIQKWVFPANAVVQGIPEYVGTTKSLKDSSQETIRLDYLKSDSSTIYGRGTVFTDAGIAGGLLPLEGVYNNIPGQSYVVHWTKSLHSNLVNDFMVNYSRLVFYWNRNMNVPDVSHQIGLTNLDTLANGPSWQSTGFGLGNAGGVAVSDLTNVYEVKDDLSIVKGSHTLKVGFEGTQRRLFTSAESSDKGSFYFADYYTAACPLGNTTCNSARDAASLTQGGMAYADFLLGAPSEILKINRNYGYWGYQNYYGAYGQDSWRPTAKLTLNMGVRYEYWTPWLVPRNMTVGFNFQTGQIQYALKNPLDYLNPSLCYGACAPLNPDVPRQGYTRSTLNFAPRVSLAYTLTPSTVLRAGFGTYYDGNVNNDQFFDIQTGAAPYSIRYQQNMTGGEQLPPFSVYQQFPAASNNPTSIPQPTDNPPDAFRFVMPYYPLAAVYEWTANVQRRLGTTWAMEIDYVGSHTIHEQQFEDMNGAALPQGQYANLTLQQRRSYPGWGILGTWVPNGWARYNGLVADIKNTTWHGLTLMGNFTWAKDMTMTIEGQSDESMVWDSRYVNTSMYAGPSPETPKFRSVIGYSYQLPFGRGMAIAPSSGRVLNAMVSGWRVSGITTFQSGSPTGIEGTDTTGTGDSFGVNKTCNPNNVPGERSYLKWFNTSCFVPAPFGTLPNSPIGAITDPGLNNWDISIGKSTQVSFPRDSGRVDFEASFFNAWNQVQWGDPQYNLSQPNFGRISTTRPARQIQFNLKYVF